MSMTLVHSVVGICKGKRAAGAGMRHDTLGWWYVRLAVNVAPQG
jgi:hypothetical protein